MGYRTELRQVRDYPLSSEELAIIINYLPLELLVDDKKLDWITMSQEFN